MSRALLPLLLALLLPLPAHSPAWARSGWLADPKTGCKVWDENMQPGESVAWSGPCVNGVAEGTGVMKWSRDGKPTVRAEGTFAGGKQTGYGVVNWAKGDHYEGEFKDGKKDGRGVFRGADGFRYLGEWKNDLYDGQGLEVRPDGLRFEGEYKAGLPNGPGVITSKEGQRHEGRWRDGEEIK